MLAPSVAVNVIASNSTFRVTGDLHEFQTTQAVTTLAQSCAGSDTQCTEVLDSIVQAATSSSSSSSSCSSSSSALSHLVVLLSMGADTILESSLPDDLRARKNAIVLSCAANTQRIFFPLAAATLKKLLDTTVPDEKGAARSFRKKVARTVSFVDDVAELLGEMVHAAEQKKEEKKQQQQQPVVSATSTFRLCVPVHMLCDLLLTTCHIIVAEEKKQRRERPRLDHLLCALRLSKLATMFVFLSASTADLSALESPMVSLSELTCRCSQQLSVLLLASMRKALGISLGEEDSRLHLSTLAHSFLEREQKGFLGNRASPLVYASFVYRVTSAVLTEMSSSSQQLSAGAEQENDTTSSSNNSYAKSLLDGWRDVARKGSESSFSPLHLSTLAVSALRLSMRGPEDEMIRATVFLNSSTTSASLESEMASVLLLLLQRAPSAVTPLLLGVIRTLVAPTLTVSQIEALVIQQQQPRLENEQHRQQLLAEILSVAALFRPHLIVPVVFSRAPPATIKATLRCMERVLLAESSSSPSQTALVERVCVEWMSRLREVEDCEGGVVRSPKVSSWLEMLLSSSSSSGANQQQQQQQKHLMVGKWVLRHALDTSSSPSSPDSLILHGVLSMTNGAPDAKVILCLVAAAIADSSSSSSSGSSNSMTSTAILTPGDIGKVMEKTSSSSSSKEVTVAAINAWTFAIAAVAQNDVYATAAFAQLLEGGVLAEPGMPMVVTALSEAAQQQHATLAPALARAVDQIAVPALRKLIFEQHGDNNNNGGDDDDDDDDEEAKLLKTAPSLHTAVAPLVAMRLVSSSTLPSASKIPDAIKQVVEKYSGGGGSLESSSSSDPFWVYGEFRKLLAEVAARLLPLALIADQIVTPNLAAVGASSLWKKLPNTSHIRFLMLLSCETILLHAARAGNNGTPDAIHPLWTITQSLASTASGFISSLAVDLAALHENDEESEDLQKLYQASVESLTVSLVGAMRSKRVAEWWNLKGSTTSSSSSPARSVSIALQRKMLSSIFSVQEIWQQLSSSILLLLDSAESVDSDGSVLLALMFLCNTCLVEGEGGSSCPVSAAEMQRVAIVACRALRQEKSSDAIKFSALKVIGCLAAKSVARRHMSAETMNEMKNAAAGFAQGNDDDSVKDAVELASQLVMLFESL